MYSYDSEEEEDAYRLGLDYAHNCLISGTSVRWSDNPYPINSTRVAYTQAMAWVDGVNDAEADV